MRWFKILVVVVMVSGGVVASGRERVIELSELTVNARGRQFLHLLAHKGYVRN